MTAAPHAHSEFFTGGLLLLAAVCTEAMGQAQFKQAADAAAHTADGRKGSFADILRRWPRLAAGVALLSVEAILYTLTLHRLDLSIAYPALSLEFAVVTVISAVYLGEVVTRKRWAGVLLILAGVALVCV